MAVPVGLPSAVMLYTCGRHLLGHMLVVVCCVVVRSQRLKLSCLSTERSVWEAYACAAEARRASGPPKPWAHCDMVCCVVHPIISSTVTVT
jgi:hypothetical protein